MGYQQLFYINVSIIFLSYAYALEGTTLPSILCAIAGAILSVLFHSSKLFQFHAKRIISDMLIYCVAIRILQLEKTMPEIFILVLCTEIHALMWMDSSYSMMQKIMGKLDLLFLSFIVISLSLPNDVIAHFANQQNGNLLQMIGFICLIFTPLKHYFYVKQRQLCKPHAQKAVTWYHENNELIMR